MNNITPSGNDLRTMEGRRAEYEAIYAALAAGDMSPTEAKTRMAIIGKIEEAANIEQANAMMGL